MTDKKTETAHAPPAHAAPKEETKENKQAIAARLLASYQHNMEHAAPRNLEELRSLQALASN